MTRERDHARLRARATRQPHARVFRVARTPLLLAGLLAFLLVLFAGTVAVERQAFVQHVGLVVLALLAVLATLWGITRTPSSHPATLHQVGIDPWEELRRELCRCRRYERPFTIVWMRRPAHKESQEQDRSRRGRWIAAGRTAEVLGTSLRVNDSVWVHRGEIFVLLPECEPCETGSLLSRIREPMPDHFPQAAIRVAGFPRDGVTVRALMSALESSTDGVTVNQVTRQAAKDGLPVHSEPLTP